MGTNPSTSAHGKSSFTDQYPPKLIEDDKADAGSIWKGRLLSPDQSMGRHRALAVRVDDWTATRFPSGGVSVRVPKKSNGPQDLLEVDSDRNNGAARKRRMIRGITALSVVANRMVRRCKWRRDPSSVGLSKFLSASWAITTNANAATAILGDSPVVHGPVELQTVDREVGRGVLEPSGEGFVVFHAETRFHARV